MKTHKIQLLALFCLLWGTLSAQTDILTTQNMFNRQNYNPAATGASDYINIFALLRQQWTGFSGAPATQMLNADNYFASLRSGLGLSIINDKMGIESNFNIKVQYAYHAFFSDNSYLSIGLSAGVLSRSIDGSSFNPDTMDDPLLNYEKFGQTSADFDFGLEYSRPLYMIGLSVTHINKSAEDANLLNAGRNFYLYSRFNVPVSDNWDVRPGAQVRYNSKSTNIELNSLVSYRRRFWAGLSYRMDEKLRSEFFSALLGVDISQNIRFGYSYDFGMGNLSRVSAGTHEIMLTFRIRRRNSAVNADDYDYNRNSYLKGVDQNAFYEY